MKEDALLQSICRNILEIHNQTPSDDEELDEFLKAGAAADLLRAFSDELMQRWYTWKTGRKNGEKERPADDTAPRQESISVSGWDIDDALAAFPGVDGDTEKEDPEGPSQAQDQAQDSLNEEEEDAAEVSANSAASADASTSADTAEEDKEECVCEDTADTESADSVNPVKPVEQPIEPEDSERNYTTDHRADQIHTDTLEEAPDDTDSATAETPLPLIDHSTHSHISADTSASQPDSTEPPPVLEDAPADQDHQEQETHSAALDSANRHHLPPQSKTMKRDTYSSTVLFKLPNAMVNTPYSEPLAVESGEVMKITKVEGLEATGIRYNSETQSVEGTPANPGEFRLTVTYTLQSGGSRLGQLDFVVNHDPKSLWKDIASDENVKFWKPDEAAEEKHGHGNWKLVAASQRGRSHAHEGKCRDDDFMLISDHPAQWHILAVSDGAGSSQYAREGAKIAVNTSAKVLAEKLTEHNDALVAAVSAWETEQSETTDADLRRVLYSIFSHAIYQAINTVHQTSKREACKFRDFYATLLLAVHKEIQGRHFLAGYWIGDGGMAVYKEGEDGYIKLLGEPDSGEYAGQTRFLDPEANDGEDIMRRISFASVDSMTALFLLTDGITDPIFETDHNLQQPDRWHRFWTEKIRPKLSDTPGETEKNLLDWLSFWSPGNHDDRTIALLTGFK